MTLVKNGQIANCCQPNALMTLKEYLMDYASPETLRLGLKVIAEELTRVPHPNVRRIATENLSRIEQGERDFRF